MIRGTRRAAAEIRAPRRGPPPRRGAQGSPLAGDQGVHQPDGIPALGATSLRFFSAVSPPSVRPFSELNFSKLEGTRSLRLRLRCPLLRMIVNATAPPRYRFASEDVPRTRTRMEFPCGSGRDVISPVSKTKRAMRVTVRNVTMTSDQIHELRVGINLPLKLTLKKIHRGIEPVHDPSGV